MDISVVYCVEFVVEIIFFSDFMKVKIIIFFMILYPIVTFASDTLNNHTEFMTPKKAVVEIFTDLTNIESNRTYAILNDYIRHNLGSIIPIVYQTNWPSDKDINMKRWSLYSRLFDMSLNNSVAVGGCFYVGERNDFDSIYEAIDRQKKIIVPLKMSINMDKSGDSAEITVNIQAVSNYGNYNLYVFLMNIIQWIPLTTLPDEKGIPVKLYEGSDTTLKIPVPKNYLNSDNITKVFATAMVQSPISGELIQAVTSYNPIKMKYHVEDKEVESGDSAYVLIKRGDETHIKFTIENPYNFSLKYDINLTTDHQLFYISFGHYDDSIIVLQPYEKRELDFVIISQNWPGFSCLNVSITPIDMNNPQFQTKPDHISIFGVTENLKCVTMFTYPYLESDADAIDDLIYDFADDWAVCPYDIFMKGFSDMPVKLYYLMLDTRNVPTFGLNRQRVDFALSLLDQGKAVILSSPFELAMENNKYSRFKYQTIPEMSSFLNDKIGIDIGRHINMFINNSYIPINVFGVPGSAFGKNVNITNCMINYYGVVTRTRDIETIKLNGNNSTTKGFLNYDILDLPADEFAGITSEVIKGRLAYLGFGLENSAYNGKKYIIENLIYWLMAESKPKRANIVVTPSDYIDFGVVDLYKDSIVKVNIKNTGDAMLTFEDISISNFNESFSYDTSAIINPLAQGGSFDLPIKFEPKKRKNMQTALIITSNSYYSKIKSLTLIGKGVLPLAEPPSGDEKNYWLDISNEKNAKNVNIKFKAGDNAKKVKISLVDSKGNVFNIPYLPNDKSALQTLDFDKKLFSNQSYELVIEVDGKIERKIINSLESK